MAATCPPCAHTCKFLHLYRCSVRQSAVSSPFSLVSPEKPLCASHSWQKPRWGGSGEAAAMALQVSVAGFSVFNQGNNRAVRALASQGVASAPKKVDEGKVNLGGSDVKVTKLGIGAWSWGDTTYWNNFKWDDRKLKAAKAAFNASLDCGITFIDTAEVYGAGISGAIKSETLIGRPGIWGNEGWSGYIDGLGDAVEQGLVKAVGVSNYSEKRLRDAYNQLKKRGIPLASNQVNYSLIYRIPEENGVKGACDELGVTLIAYSPIAQGMILNFPFHLFWILSFGSYSSGILSGKYTPANPPTGPRGRIYTPEFLTKLEPLISRIKEIGQSYGKTPTQVVLNWLICQGNVVPIPGAKNAEQAQEFAGSLGWWLSDEEVLELRSLASQTKPVIGFPVEKL
ncbi:hypothetical protein Taro_022726 [Colocasia esculenta]|uniref:NADP-dependent oxidoreductase domain-containing protein n=1 Tax=Colocasia esculenta TaxID=4460 RepID=A0A843UV77_COLES|nr:hypothetical protein [Colocasia esculenta]